MTSRIRSLFAVLCLAASLFAMPGPAIAQDLGAAVNRLGSDDFNEIGKAIAEIARIGGPAAARTLEALSSNSLYRRTNDRKVFIAERTGRVYKLTDPVTGKVAAEAGRRAVKRIRINNAVRRDIAAALGELKLTDANPEVRRAAADSLFKRGDPAALDSLKRAIERESDDSIKKLMTEARAAALLKSDAPEAEKIAAIDIIALRGDREAMGMLRGIAAASEGKLKEAAAEGAHSIERTIAVWDAVNNVWYGLSLGSVLLLAAAGLAITFGVMGVINMAHGEIVMLGAYTTFVVQQAFRDYYPAGLDYALFVAIPAAFIVAGAFGIAIERSVIRFLYGRPLETLLATWGISLVLQQFVRSIFGPTNREVSTPSWMSGTIEVTSGLALTANRMAIVAFAALVFILLLLVISKTSFGLQMRAVTQNRPMANAMGIHSSWVDSMTFGLGSGVAGMAGVALSQIDNVSPNLGQAYIIDSFLVVVFGGVGNLWGTLVGALSLGVFNKFLEPFSGAVLAKILILVAVILFIQRRPRGLFALKGRAVES